MPNCTLKATLLDRLHEQASDRETRYAFLETDARCLAGQAAEVYNAYTFTRANALCRCTPAGVCTQAAMTLTGPAENAYPEQVTVIAKIEGGEETIWFITDMTALAFPASVYIRAVQARLEANRDTKASRSSKAVNG